MKKAVFARMKLKAMPVPGTRLLSSPGMHSIAAITNRLTYGMAAATEKMFGPVMTSQADAKTAIIRKIGDSHRSSLCDQSARA